MIKVVLNLVYEGEEFGQLGVAADLERVLLERAAKLEHSHVVDWQVAPESSTSNRIRLDEKAPDLMVTHHPYLLDYLKTLQQHLKEDTSNAAMASLFDHFEDRDLPPNQQMPGWLSLINYGALYQHHRRDILAEDARELFHHWWRLHRGDLYIPDYWADEESVAELDIRHLNLLILPNLEDMDSIPLTPVEGRADRRLFQRFVEEFEPLFYEVQHRANILGGAYRRTMAFHWTATELTPLTGDHLSDWQEEMDDLLKNLFRED